MDDCGCLRRVCCWRLRAGMSTFENGLIRLFATGRPGCSRKDCPGCLRELGSWCLERGVQYV